MKILLLIMLVCLMGAGCEDVDNRSEIDKAVDLCTSKGGVPILGEDHWGQVEKSIKDCKFPN